MLDPNRLITQSCRYIDATGNWIDIRVTFDYGRASYMGFAYTREGNEMLFDDLQRQMLRPKHRVDDFDIEMSGAIKASHLAAKLADILGAPWANSLVTYGTPEGVTGILLDPPPVFQDAGVPNAAVPPVIQTPDGADGGIPEDPAQLERDFLSMFKSFAPLFGAAIKQVREQVDELAKYPTSSPAPTGREGGDPSPPVPGSVEIDARTRGGAHMSVTRVIETGSPLKIGSHSRNHLCLDDPQVSRVHAYVERDPNGVLRIVDLGSGKYTYVNGARVTQRVLSPGDAVIVGNTTITFDDVGI